MEGIKKKNIVRMKIQELIETDPLLLIADDYQSLLSCSKFLPTDFSAEEWSDLILKVSKIVKSREGLVACQNYIEDTYKEFRKKCASSFVAKKKILETLCKEYLSTNNQTKAHETMNRYVYVCMAEISFTATNHKMRYYSFRPFSEYSLKDIKNETISLAHPREFNDPLDTILVYWLDQTIEKQGELDEIDLKFSLLLKKVSENIKLRCLIGNQYEVEGQSKIRNVEELSFLMWSHYAKSHTGFCVEYEFERDLFDNDVDEKKIQLIEAVSYPQSIKVENKPTFKTCLFEKSDFWKYEHEMRLVQFDVTTPAPGENREYPTISCKGMIKAIYLGVRCSDKDKLDMIKAIGDKDIPLFKMEIDSTNVTRLIKIQIG